MVVPEINTVILLDREVLPICTFKFLIVCPFEVLLLHLFGFNTDDGHLTYALNVGGHGYSFVFPVNV